MSGCVIRSVPDTHPRVPPNDSLMVAVRKAYHAMHSVRVHSMYGAMPEGNKGAGGYTCGRGRGIGERGKSKLEKRGPPGRR
jgi:hypothetical protein